LITIDGVFGGWEKAQKTHFADGSATISVLSMA
jgi:ABC-type sulfate transport system substrate-binding protein